MYRGKGDGYSTGSFFAASCSNVDSSENQEKKKEPAVKVADRKLFFRLVKMGFGQRRKVFTNAMKSGGISTELGKKILERAGIDGGRRGETFSMEEYAALANAWDELVVNK